MKHNKMQQLAKNIKAMIGSLAPVILDNWVDWARLVTVTDTRLLVRVRTGHEESLYNYLEGNSSLYRDDKIWNHAKHSPENYKPFIGWRSFGSPSLQIIVHSPGAWNRVGWVLEFDIDRWGPDDARGLLFHFFGEYVWHRLANDQTNSFKIANVLRSQGYEV